MNHNPAANTSADQLVAHAVDTIRERANDELFRSSLSQVESEYLEKRSDHLGANRDRLESILRESPELWPMRLYLADTYLQLGEEERFESEVGMCLAKSGDSFVVVSLFMFMTRLYVLRSPSIEASVKYVRETLENNPSVEPYVRSIYIQTLLEAGEFEEAYVQLQVAVEENNPMLTVEGVEILPILLARLGRWDEQQRVITGIQTFAMGQLNDNERADLVRTLIADVQEQEQLGDLPTARLIMEVAKAIDPKHPDVVGYLSIGVQMPKGWWPVQ